MEVYKVYYDAYQEARWFTDQIPLLRNLLDSNLIPLTTVVNNPEIGKMLRYDKPDIIVTQNNKVVLAFEKTTEVPTGHNVGQRFARIVCSAEERVPFIYFFPFVARKHGAYSSTCWVNARLFDAIKNLSKFHSTPILLVDWPVDSNYELIRDGSQDCFISKVLTELFDSKFDLSIPIIKEVYRIMEEKYNEAIIRYPSYANLPKTAIIVKTEDYIEKVKNQTPINLPDYFSYREKSLVYTIGMRYVRSDPYTGTQLIYDYAKCRKGPLKTDRDVNLVLYMPYITYEMWNKAAQRPNRKDVKIYSIFSDAIQFKNGVYNYERE